MIMFKIEKDRFDICTTPMNLMFVIFLFTL